MTKKKSLIIRDAVHGDIYFDHPVFAELIDSAEFQRLRRVAQLGGAQFAYPTATHTRFTHSIGVYWVIKMFLKNPQISSALTVHDQELVLIAGLLHDLGHGPFSHSFENITNLHHEEYSQKIIVNPQGNIALILNKYGYNPQDVADIIQGVYPNQIVNLLVSSQLDADRLDYLKRDAYFAGVNYSSLDVSWLINNAMVVDQKIAFNSKAIYAVESYLLGRYHMFKQVYNHKISLAFDALIQVWFKRIKDLYQLNYQFVHPRILYFFESLLKGEELSLERYLQLDDFTMDEIFKLTASESDLILADLSTKILNRQFFKIYKENEIDKQTIQSRLRKQNLDPTYYTFQSEPKKLYVYQNEHVGGKDEEIYFYQNDKQLITLSELSELNSSFEKINKEKVQQYIFIF
ncbi:hypothetical protein LD125_00419 [Mesoplasma sp. JKS002658]|uniref:HD domain-containing protein n=1 Tax=Mesoplasma whartonense TaxID=2878854 RepID=UPI0020229DA6|nr:MULTISPECIES: HD domain-containing protein [unclassified Mesoplasma]MCL8211463.1 hypothetical protein [Mesoplasma sp. JKS002664]MCL8212315.1 hypothetical protein [Mesoplasma sp. JKS002662]MCL8212424.1 hypothetical protein [Mesoplasma sp. JKS002661]MCL8213463.1 hypothetical protein [Mesoplasma sp. JKS002660]MCL8214156.1 hypothetical protein [Mesoplasma sp. JKS002658]